MTTFSTMRNRILSELNRTKADDLTATAENHIKSAIAHYEKERFHFMEQRATSNTESGQEYYPVPSDYLDVDSLTIEVNNHSYPLNRRHYSRIQDWHVKSSVFLGYPTEFAVFGTQEQTEIRLYPTPNGEYTLTLSYYKKLAEVNAEADENTWFDTEGEELIRARAGKTINLQKLRDYDAAQACGVVEQEALQAARRETKMRQFTGHTRKRSGSRWA